MVATGGGRAGVRNGGLIKQISDAAAKHANNSLREKNITLTQVRVLLMLYDHGTMPLKEIERRLQVAQPSVAGVISRLRSKGLVTAWTSPEDSRVKLVKLTEGGIQYGLETRRDIDHLDERMFAGFTEEDKDRLNKYLVKIYENLK